ncbi:MAG: sulfatase-like hydrolase/transferase, partial [Planctomycetes bacterium]|nr:sulfatase-like hydrolase/transferase [Planctomycetota bacterium]
MSARLLHGILLGTLVVLVAVFLELRSLFSDWPYHRDWGLAWEWWLAYAASGALLGACSALVLPLLDRKRIRAGQPGLSLLSPILGGAVTFAAFFGGHFANIGGAALQALASLTSGAFVAIALLGFARGPLGWTISGFVTPWFCCLGLAILTGWAAALNALGPQPARNTQVTAAPAAEQCGPNVLLVVLDTLNARHLGSYGYHRPTSPALDALADEGVVFDRAYSAAPWTLPSHASLFTGLHPTSHRTGWTHPRLDDGRAIGSERIRYDYLTLSEELNARGYHTVGVSKKSWLTQEYGLTQGFQEYYDYSILTAGERLLLPRALDRLMRYIGYSSPLHTPAVDQGGSRVVDTALHWLREDR